VIFVPLHPSHLPLTLTPTPPAINQILGRRCLGLVIAKDGYALLRGVIPRQKVLAGNAMPFVLRPSFINIQMNNVKSLFVIIMCCE
jgi:hypothetical protein